MSDFLASIEKKTTITQYTRKTYSISESKFRELLRLEDDERIVEVRHSLGSYCGDKEIDFPIEVDTEIVREEDGDD